MVYECKICGASLKFEEGARVAKCEYCQTMQTLPKEKNEGTVNLLNRANKLRLKCEFDKAQEVYEKIIEGGSNDSEAFWGLVLCKYGIEYVEDVTHERIPTCHRTQIEPVLTDIDYQSVIANADNERKEIYEEQAKAIDKVQKNILTIVNKEEPYDIFICYKESDESGKRTKDSVIANDIYYRLTQEGYKVFYAAITLEDKLGQEYEPYIFAALNSAKVMLVVGTKEEYFNAVWVKNEWSRYLKIMGKDKGRLLIPCYRDMDAYDLPIEFGHLQAQDMGKIGFIEDLIRGIKKIIKKEQPKKEQPKEDTSKKEMEEMFARMQENMQKDIQKALEKGEPKKEKVIVQENTGGGANVNSLLKRARVFLEDKDFVSANNYAEKVLDLDAECADAYIVKLLADLKLSSESLLSKQENFFYSNSNYAKAVRYATGERLTQIKGYNEAIFARKYSKFEKQMAKASKSKDFEALAISWNSLIPYRDSAKREAECKEIAVKEREKEIKAANEEKYQSIYKQMQSATKSYDFARIAEAWSSLIPYRDSYAKKQECIKQTEIAKENEIKDENYNKAKACIKKGNSIEYREAIEILEKYPDWRDSQSLIEEYTEKQYELERAEKEKRQHDKKLVEYNKAIKLMKSWTLSSVYSAELMFNKLGDFKDSREKYQECYRKIDIIRRADKKEKADKSYKVIAKIFFWIIAVLGTVMMLVQAGRGMLEPNDMGGAIGNYYLKIALSFSVYFFIMGFLSYLIDGDSSRVIGVGIAVLLVCWIFIIISIIDDCGGFINALIAGLITLLIKFIVPIIVAFVTSGCLQSKDKNICAWKKAVMISLVVIFVISVIIVFPYVFNI